MNEKKSSKDSLHVSSFILYCGEEPERKKEREREKEREQRGRRK
jgi:hypothetical protein